MCIRDRWYKIEHKSPQYIDEAVYGLCEINREKVKQARIVSNPGCYPTCSTPVSYTHLVETDGTVGDIVKTLEQIDDGCFSGTRHTHDAECVALL